MSTDVPWDRGDLLAACCGPTISVYQPDLNAQGKMMLIPTSGRSSQCCQFGGKGRVIINASDESSLTVIAPGLHMKQDLLGYTNSSTITCAKLPATVLAAGGSQGEFVLKLDGDGQQPIARKAHSARVVALEYSPSDSVFITSSADATLSAWSDKSASKKFDLPNDERRPVRTLHCWGEGRMLCGGADNGSILLWNLRSRLTTQRFMNAFNGPVTGVSFLTTPTPTGDIVTCGDQAVKLIDRRKQDPVVLLQSHEHMSALSARDGTYEVAVGTSCGSAMVIDVRKASQGVLSTRHLSANSNEAVTQVHWQINAYNTYSLVKKVKSEAAGAGAGAGQAQRTAQVQAPYLGRAAEATPMQADTLQPTGLLPGLSPEDSQGSQSQAEPGTAGTAGPTPTSGVAGIMETPGPGLFMQRSTSQAEQAELQRRLSFGSVLPGAPRPAGDLQGRTQQILAGLPTSKYSSTSSAAPTAVQPGTTATTTSTAAGTFAGRLGSSKDGRPPSRGATAGSAAAPSAYGRIDSSKQRQQTSIVPGIPAAKSGSSSRSSSPERSSTTAAAAAARPAAGVPAIMTSPRGPAKAVPSSGTTAGAAAGAIPTRQSSQQRLGVTAAAKPAAPAAVSGTAGRSLAGSRASSGRQAQGIGADGAQQDVAAEGGVPDVGYSTGADVAGGVSMKAMYSEILAIKAKQEEHNAKLKRKLDIDFTGVDTMVASQLHMTEKNMKAMMMEVMAEVMEPVLEKLERLEQEVEQLRQERRQGWGQGAWPGLQQFLT